VALDEDVSVDDDEEEEEGWRGSNVLPVGMLGLALPCVCVCGLGAVAELSNAITV
jgi:hypothetical protein